MKPCIDCGMQVTSQASWYRIAPDVRKQHIKDRTLSRHQARGRCHTCDQYWRRSLATEDLNWSDEELALTGGRWVPKSNGVLKWIPNRKEDAA